MSPTTTPTRSNSPTGATTPIPTTSGLFDQATRYITITSVNAAGRLDPASVTPMPSSLGYAARQVILRRPYSAGSAPLTIDEVVVLDTRGINVAQRGDVDVSSTATGSDARYIIDGFFPTTLSPALSQIPVWLSASSGEDDWVVISSPLQRTSFQFPYSGSPIQSPLSPGRWKFVRGSVR
jgi:hypothetical protein